MYVTNPNDFAEANTARIFPMVKGNSTSPQNVKDVPTGKCLFREGDEARKVYEVVSGVLRLTRVMENGRRQVIAFGFPGDIVGFPSDGYHHTECDAILGGEVIVHPSEAMLSDKGDPELRTRLFQAALREIGAMQDHFVMLGRKTARERIASFLAVLSDRVGTPVGAYQQIQLPMTRSDIADFLGLTMETVSRTISQLKKAGIIALDGSRSMIILQPDTLLEYSECE